ncbi:SRP72 RNA-binding domain-containing protein [Tanacetum coccineum]
MLPKFSQIVNRLYAFIYETNHSKSGLGLPSIVALVMVIDKSWTSLGKHEKAFYTGLKKFVDDCKPLVDSAGNIRCPCKSCRLVLWVSIKHLSDHISKSCLTSGRTWIPPADRDLRRQSTRHLHKSHNTNKASSRPSNWKADPYHRDLQMRRRSAGTSRGDYSGRSWDKYISRQASDTQEYPSLIDTFWRTHTVDGVFPKDEDRRIYEEMKRLEATGEYTEDEINA